MFTHQTRFTTSSVTEAMVSAVTSVVSTPVELSLGVLIFRNEMKRKPPAIIAKMMMVWMSSLIHLVFQVTCTFSQIIPAGSV